MKRIGIFGGSFNPPHKGHIRVAEVAMKALHLDRVVFVPLGASACKTEELLCAEERLVLCRLAIADKVGFEVNDCDIRRGGTTYTYDTLTDMHELFPDAELWFITGSDAFSGIDSWKHAEALSSLASFGVVCREDYLCDGDAILASCHSIPRDRIAVLGSSQCTCSSHAVRAMLEGGELPTEDVPCGELMYIVRKGLYGASGLREQAGVFDEEPFDDDFVQARMKELSARVSEGRFAHTLNVAKTATMLAKTYGYNERRAYLAGLLHDWDKNYNDEQIRERARDLGVDAGEMIMQDMPYALHGMTAAAWFAQTFPEIPADVISAIRRHTTAALDMSPLDMIVYIADSIEPGRVFPGVDTLRSVVGRYRLEDLFFTVHGQLLVSIIGRKKCILPESVYVWNHYAKRCVVPRGKLTDPDKMRTFTTGTDIFAQ